MGAFTPVKRARFFNFKKDGLFLEAAVRVGLAWILNGLSRQWLDYSQRIYMLTSFNTIRFYLGLATQAVSLRLEFGQFQI
jgi:hypothetical protein